MTEPPKLSHNDVAIIGEGMASLTTAAYLARARLKRKFVKTTHR
jgi:thioredoxin reductase